VRQPARATLGVLGVAAVGALLFDMLMLSDGLIVSMRDLLERTGFDIRVTASGDLRRVGDRMHDTDATLAAMRRLPQVGTVLAIRFVEAEADGAGGPIALTLEGVQGDARPWTVLSGRDPAGEREVVVSQALASTLGVEPGREFDVRARCAARNQVLPPARLRVVGIAEFPFELVGDPTVGTAMQTLDEACASRTDESDIILAAALDDVDVTAAAVRAAQPRLNVATNEQVIGRLQRNGFTYFRQISSVLTAVTLAFALLLITVLLTVSVNQRLGEIAALRALGFSRGRVVADVLCESLLIVGFGGLISLPLGAVLARGLDSILKTMPGIPGQMYFFVLEPATLGLHASLLALTAIAAALYPMQIVARLPIAATLRNEVLS
jgi:ABC-type lipoprotein release transport system permease subunit